MKHTIITLAFSIASFVLFSQTDLVRLDDLSYHSTFEEWAVRQHFLNDATSPFLLYSATDKTVSESEAKKLEHDFYKLLDEIKAQVAQSNNPKKKTKWVFEAIHARYLKRYQATANFGSLFENGDFNCLTASCLYAIAYAKLELPYEIVVAPGHVFLIVYPNSHRFIVETTNPVNGIYQFNEKKFDKYKERLLRYKLINEHEFEVLTFKDFQYRQDSNVNLFSLNSYLYSNQLYVDDEMPRNELFSYAQKSYIFNPIETKKEELEQFTKSFLWGEGYQKAMYKPVLMYARIADSASRMEAKNNFKIILTKDPEEAQASLKIIDEIYLKLKTVWPADSLFTLDSVASPYYLAKGYYYQTQQEFKKASTYFLKLYTIAPKNKYIEWLIYAKQRQFSGYGLDVILADLNELKEAYPEVVNNNVFADWYFTLLIKTAAQHYTFQNITKGLELRKQFEKNYNHQVTSFPESVGDAYVVIASYYFKKGKDKQAKIAINKGIEYNPANMKLLKLKMSLD